MAIWLLARIVPGPVSLILWAILCTIAAGYLGAFTPAASLPPTLPRPINRMRKGISLLMLVYASMLVVGAGMGNHDPLAPLSGLRGPTSSETAKKADILPFHLVHSLDQAQVQLNQAKAANQPAILDFHADWCLTCEALDKTVFKDPEVKKALANYRLIRADLTEVNANTQALQKHFDVIAPPHPIIL